MTVTECVAIGNMRLAAKSKVMKFVVPPTGLLRLTVAVVVTFTVHTSVFPLFVVASMAWTLLPT